MQFLFVFCFAIACSTNLFSGLVQQKEVSPGEFVAGRGRGNLDSLLKTYKRLSVDVYTNDKSKALRTYAQILDAKARIDAFLSTSESLATMYRTETEEYLLSSELSQKQKALLEAKYYDWIEDCGKGFFVNYKPLVAKFAKLIDFMRARRDRILLVEEAEQASFEKALVESYCSYVNSLFKKRGAWVQDNKKSWFVLAWVHRYGQYLFDPEHEGYVLRSPANIARWKAVQKEISRISAGV